MMDNLEYLMKNALEDMGYDDDKLYYMSYEELKETFESIFGDLGEFLKEETNE